MEPEVYHLVPPESEDAFTGCCEVSYAIRDSKSYLVQNGQNDFWSFLLENQMSNDTKDAIISSNQNLAKLHDISLEAGALIEQATKNLTKEQAQSLKLNAAPMSMNGLLFFLSLRCCTMGIFVKSDRAICYLSIR